MWLERCLGSGLNVRQVQGNKHGSSCGRFECQKKMKVFAWRACHEILPTRVNLAKRKIIIDNTCRYCQQALETAIHAI